MTAYEIISEKRNGQPLSREEIHFFINEFLKGNIEDYQMTAFLMATYFSGMNEDEIFALTESYIESGRTIDLSDIPGIKVDKHSTGGVGDKVSIVLAPLAASLGVIVPMISGRGLGHTGGTLDKLESITGFQVFGELKDFKKQLADIGVAMLGQTDSIVPADRRIYALRDVTATIESIPLITASIMSKKIAEGIDGLVLDVKYGNGAFMTDPEKAEKLAKNLISVGNAFGKKVIAYLTSMQQPLGFKIGNWLEIEECLDTLHGNGPQDLLEVTLALTGEMLIIAGKAHSFEEAKSLCLEALGDGRAFNKFLEMVEYQGGDVNLVKSPEKYPKAIYREVVKSPTTGVITAFNTREIGLVGVELGAGRKKAEDEVDPQAGIILFKKIGDKVNEQEELAEIRSNKKDSLDKMKNRLIAAIEIGNKIDTLPELIFKKIE
jgi:pyrimidine-nucleoside phosphorylase